MSRVLGVQGLGLKGGRVEGLGFRASGSGFRVLGSGCSELLASRVSV